MQGGEGLFARIFRGPPATGLSCREYQFSYSIFNINLRSFSTAHPDTPTFRVDDLAQHFDEPTNPSCSVRGQITIGLGDIGGTRRSGTPDDGLQTNENRIARVVEKYDPSAQKHNQREPGELVGTDGERTETAKP